MKRIAIKNIRAKIRATIRATIRASIRATKKFGQKFGQTIPKIRAHEKIGQAAPRNQDLHQEIKMSTAIRRCLHLKAFGTMVVVRPGLSSSASH